MSMSLEGIGTECAVAAVHLYDHNAQVFPYLYHMLHSMQDRFNMSVGVAVYAEQRPHQSQLYVERHAGDHVQGFGHPKSRRYPGSLERIIGYSGIAHGRYATSHANQTLTATEIVALAHPYEERSTRDLARNFAVAFNGNIINAEDLIDKEKRKERVFTTETDGELIKILLTGLLREYRHETLADYQFIFNDLSSQLDGAYCIVFNDATGKTIALRDPHGFRPLCYAKNDRGIFIASESTALLDLGFTKPSDYHDIPRGHFVMIEKDGTFHGPVPYTKQEESRFCIFEHVYFASVTSILDRVSVQRFRMLAGEALARRELLQFTPEYVIGIIPETSQAFLDGYMKALRDIRDYVPPVVNILIKKKGVDGVRSFLHDNAGERAEAVRRKFRITPGIVEGQKVVLLDDSVVRGNTTRETTRYVQEVGGAEEVHIRSGYDKFKYACWMGIDAQRQEELIASLLSSDEAIAEAVGAKSIVFNDISGLVAIARDLDPRREIGFCDACATGNYPTPAGQRRFEVELERLGIGRPK